MSELQSEQAGQAAAKIRMPISTYRLQLHAGFTFSQATAIVDYLADLGVTDIYASPILRAEKGSTHGYNVVDYDVINPELGGEEGFQAFSAALKARGMGLVVDFVPNHMGVASGENGWWNDVLENGPSSLFADRFDIEWNSPKASLKNRVLYPILGAQYGEVLENGDLVLAREGGTFVLRYFDHQLPVAPRSMITLLERAVANLTLAEDDAAKQELRSIVTALTHLPSREETLPEKRLERAREKEIIKRRLDTLTSQSADVARAVDDTVRETNGKKGDRASFEQLDAILLEQSYRLAYWRVATEEINYRRFFDVNQLVAVRMESPEVFDAAHARIFALVREGSVTGLRLDHTDGLYDPADYFERLRSSGAGDLYVVAEKILEPAEKLPLEWKIEGTSGYDALASLNGVWVDPSSERALTALYERITSDTTSFDEHVLRGKRAVIRTSFAGEINVLALALERIAESSRRSRDFTLRSLTFAVVETIAAFPVYRTYIRADGGRGPNDDRHVERAIRSAKRRNTETDASVFDFLRDVLLLRDPQGTTGAKEPDRVRFAMRFQQLTGPIMAKGVEDTAYYRYNRLVMLNEVGAQPSRFGTSLAAYHADNAERRTSWPKAMTATSTHDTKRGEDVRARLAVVTEIPELWESRVNEWRGIAEKYRTIVDDEPAPSPSDEYLFFQSVFGATPFHRVDPNDAAAADTFTKRISAYMSKATREAKLRTSWTNPSADYDAAIPKFCQAMLGDSAFTSSVRALADATVTNAATNALGQVALKLTAPGIPDTYQGCEGWSFDLVDPDNRRPVDYDVRRAFLNDVNARREDRAGLARDLLRRFDDGAIKLYVTHALLNLRRTSPDLFAQGGYDPIDAGENVVAFARSHVNSRLITVVPRLSYRLTRGLRPWPIADAWGDARITLPTRGPWQNVFTGATLEGTDVRLSDVFAEFPIAVFTG